MYLQMRETVVKGLARLSNTELARIDIGTLDLASADTCVLGQVYGPLFVDSPCLSGHTWAWCLSYGYALDGDGDYAALTALWIDAITERRYLANGKN